MKKSIRLSSVFIFPSCLCKVFSIIILVALGFSNVVSAAEANLILDPPDCVHAGYKIYYGTANASYSQIVDVGNVKSYTISGLQEGQKYYFAATAYDKLGSESSFSNEIYKYIPKSDTDGDGLPDIDEINLYGTNPKNADTDGDGIADDQELNVFKTDPNNPDTDEDGYLDGEEIYTYKTDPNSSDTDGDGILDGQQPPSNSTKETQIIVDNNDSEFSSGPNKWARSSFSPGGYETYYQYSAPNGGKNWAKWKFKVPTTGESEVFARWTTANNRSKAATYTISSKGLKISVPVDQTVNGGQFVSLGTYWIEAGDVEVLLTDSPTGYVIADAVMMICGAERVSSVDDIKIADIIIDNDSDGFSSGPGEWARSSYSPGYYGSNYQYAPPSTDGRWAKWMIGLPVSGYFEVYASWTMASNRSEAAPFTISNNGAQTSVTVNQTENGDHFVSLGTYWFEAGTAEVMLKGTRTGYVIADAVKISQR